MTSTVATVSYDKTLPIVTVGYSIDRLIKLIDKTRRMCRIAYEWYNEGLHTYYKDDTLRIQGVLAKLDSNIRFYAADELDIINELHESLTYEYVELLRFLGVALRNIKDVTDLLTGRAPSPTKRVGRRSVDTPCKTPSSSDHKRRSNDYPTPTPSPSNMIISPIPHPSQHDRTIIPPVVLPSQMPDPSYLSQLNTSKTKSITSRKAPVLSSKENRTYSSLQALHARAHIVQN